MKSVHCMTPFEVWHGKKLVVHHLRTFGCIVYIQNMMPHLEKLEDPGLKMIFVDYKSGSMAYRVYDPITKRVHVMCGVVFDEKAQWDWGTSDDDGELGYGDDVFAYNRVYHYWAGGFKNRRSG
jgi:hypothetical protein